jgi:hypothetical protein
MDPLPIRVVSEYKMPPICCVCGAPSGPAKFKVYASAWNRRRPFGVYFPLCPTCEQTYSTVDNRRRLGCWTSVGLAFLVAVVGIVAQIAIAGANSWAGLTFLFFFGLLLLGVVAYLLVPLFFPAPTRAYYQRVRRAVQIKEYRPSGALGPGTMVLAFAHHSFAEAFRALNEHLVIRDQ